MQNAMSLGGIFGPFLIILGIWMLFYHANMMKVFTSIRSTPGVLYTLGIVNLLVGLTVLNLFNKWILDLSILVTLFGWLILLRGLLGLFAPQFLYKKIMSDKKTFKIKGVIVLLWGIGMTWLAFRP